MRPPNGLANPGLFLWLPRLGGRTIGSTSDSDSDYPGSSPGLPAKIHFPLSTFHARPVLAQAGPNQVKTCAEKKRETHAGGPPSYPYEYSDNWKFALTNGAEHDMSYASRN